LKQIFDKKPLEERGNPVNCRRRKKILQISRRTVVRTRVRTFERPAGARLDVSVPLPPLESFFSLFRDDNDCLEFLWRSRHSSDGTSALCPECGDLREFRVGVDKTAHLQWQCAWCGCFLSPIAGTIFQKSQIPLHLYFDAMGTLAEPGRPMQVDELAYELGVSFETATKLVRDLDGRLDARDAASPRFVFDLMAAEDLTVRS
jgi:hypothetical protein